MMAFGFVLLCVAVLALAAACASLLRRVSLMEKAFRAAAERLEDIEYV